MASSIEDILLAKSMAEARDRADVGLPIGLGATAGAAMGGSLPLGGFKGRMAGGLVGAIIGGALGGGIKQAAVGESPAAALLAKMQAQGQLNPLDRAQLQSVLKQIYSSQGI